MRRLSLFPSRRITSEAAVKSLYASAARGWHSGLQRIGYGEAYQVLTQRALASAPLLQPARVLDAGAGTGALSAAYAKNAPVPCRLDLLDLSPDMLALASHTKNGSSHVIQGALGTSEIAPQSYDRVLCGHVIEHCSDAQRALDWLFQCLIPGGQLVLAVSKPHWCTALIRWKYGSAAYPPSAVKHMLANSGFTHIQALPHPSGPPSRISCGYLATRPV